MLIRGKAVLPSADATEWDIVKPNGISNSYSYKTPQYARLTQTTTISHRKKIFVVVYCFSIVCILHTLEHVENFILLH